MKKDIRSYTRNELVDLMVELKQPAFRGKQLFEWLYTHSVTSYDAMTNLPAALRETLSQEYPLVKSHVINRQISKDGTRKYIIEYPDGARVETVAIPSKRNAPRHHERASLASPPQADQINGQSTSAAPMGDLPIDPQFDRLSVCFSTQVGCAMQCSFCATGKEGFTRNLTPGEMIDQITAVQADFPHTRVSNLVAMGQGEPFLNYDNTLSALRIANAADALNIGARHITVSTCGIIQGIDRLAQEPEQFTLAISLHSAVQATRDILMPSMAPITLPALKESLRGYCAATNRRVTLEYLMIDGVNDTKAALAALQAFCRDLLCHINLLPMNAVDGTPLRPSSHAAMNYWMTALNAQGIETTTRQSRGSDIAGACGQLKNSL